MKSNEIVKRWVDKRSSFYFFLPDGPYGRPFDNQYTVEKIVEAVGGFKIFLSDGLTLVFTGGTEVLDEGCNLTIKGFELFIFEINGAGIKKYDRGEVVLSGF
ncbi:hypothetical protein [Dryocola sp. BD613]|uniref:hypothetical protein n=1 Tax=Dryocola sp. BD613 TaxID=3133272 RepID=UPI003F4F6C09